MPASLPLLVDGRWVSSASASTTDVVDPVTEAVLGTVPAGDPADAAAAVTAAAEAFPAWSRTTPAERAALLRAWHAALEARSAALVDLVRSELGTPLPVARRVQVALPLSTLRSCADLAESYVFEEQAGPSLVVRQPAGVVAAITPWNYPLHQAMAKVAAALAAGCTVVLKPSELAPLTVQAAIEAAVEAGVPAGVLGLVHGAGPVVGEALAGDPRVDLVSFTGSVPGGRRVAEVAARNGTRTVLELGGKSPSVVLPDVSDDLFERAVRETVARCLLNSGQTCTAWTRLLVPRPRYEEAVEQAARAAAAFTPGDRYGPLVTAAARERVLAHVTNAVAAGARIAVGGLDRPEGHERGHWVRPTVLADVDPSWPIAQEEVFGPVLVVLPYDDEDHALALAEGTPYGLAGGVWCDDVDHAVSFARRLRAGQVDVNGARFNPLAPFGGFKSSGHGRELGVHGLEEFLVPQSVQL
jgi:aldehyde dehydrogenase (NAD+)